MARGVHQDDVFAERLVELVPLPAARAAILEGIALTLAVDPTLGAQVDPGDTHPDTCWMYVIPSAPGWGVPRMRVIYTFDEATVRLHWLELAPP